MYKETKLSEQAQKIEEALLAVPPRYAAADKIFADYSITKEELAKIACDLLHECLNEQSDYWDDIKTLIDENTVTSNIYRVMQYLFSKGYEPNVVVDDGCAMGTIPFLVYPEGLAPKLMRLFMENGGDPNLVVEGIPVFEEVEFAVAFDKYMFRSFVYCWLVLMAYGGRVSREKYLPLTMHDGLDVSIFKRFEDYAYYKIVPEKDVPGELHGWEMLIFYTADVEEPPRLVATSSYLHWAFRGLCRGEGIVE
ncbi:MAG: hypothetical protein IKT09_07905 [Synergistes sp.]|nr:hypothetical protein [Synergistes sp.]